MAKSKAQVDENDLIISPAKNGILHHGSPVAKPLVSTENEKATILEEDQEKNKRIRAGTNDRASTKKTKITDFFPQRRSQRKTQEALNAEKHQQLVKMILDQIQDGLKVVKISGKGRGVIATKKFYRNEFVVEYSGTLLSGNAARELEKKYAKDHRAGCYMYYFQHKSQQYCVDATEETDRLGRLINHSRNGNLVPKIVQVKMIPRLILMAKRDIMMNEELCYDYGDRSKEALKHHPWLAY